MAAGKAAYWYRKAAILKASLGFLPGLSGGVTRPSGTDDAPAPTVAAASITRG